MRKNLIITAWGILAFIAACLLTGCTDAEWDQQFNYGSEATVVIYGASGPVKTYHSTGRVEFQENGTVVYFRDKESGNFIIISGTFSVEYDN